MGCTAGRSRSPSNVRRRGNVMRVLIAFLVGFTMVATDAAACSCIRAVDALATIGQTDAVFRARVATTMMVLTESDGTIVYRNEGEKATGVVQRLVVLRIEELFKGVVAPLTVLVTG